MAQSGELVSNPHHSLVQTCPHIIIASLEKRWLLSSDVEAKKLWEHLFLDHPIWFHRFVGSYFSKRIFLFFRAKFVVLPVHRPNESSVNVGLTDIVELMGKI
jgi:hypothetical protein